jgi:C4-dicarboxylate transporter, DctM subunit
MTPLEIGFIGCGILIVLIFMGMNLAFTLIISGFVGFALIGGVGAALGNLAIIPFDRMTSYGFTVFPMFMLMGSFVSYGGIGSEAYTMARAWFGHFRGGLAIATIGACGLFAAVQGTSLAGSIVMGKVAYPEMRRAGYSMPLAAACVSVGGTLGILIPPSMGFIMIGIMTELNIGELFMAGIIPGILVCIFYMGTIVVLTRINPSLAPSMPPVAWKQRASSLRLGWPIVLLFLLVMGGIYGGVFTATEAGAIGAAGALIISLAKRQMSRRAFYNSLWDTARMMGMIIVVLSGVFLFNAFLSITEIPFKLGEFLVGLPLSRYVVLIVILVIYIILGMFFDVLAILILTIPILYPAVDAMGFNLIWYSVLMVRIIEIGEISPPFGINLFGLKGVIDAPLGAIYRGVIPFLFADMVNLAVLVAFPVISTIIPETMF